MTFTKGSLWLLCLWSLLFFSACSRSDRQQVDKLNSISYAYHYRNLDSTYSYARRAYDMSGGYGAGKAAALNNMAFVSIARMDYELAEKQLEEALDVTDNHIELLVAEVQKMRLCQRMSQNRRFYDYRERANSRISRINEERFELSDAMLRRMIYAETEFAIVNSTYYFYVGLERQSIDAISVISPDGDIRKDTAQYLNYLYNIGVGGIITGGSQAEINQREFDYLIKCLIMAGQGNYPFFVANSLEALSEHLLKRQYRNRLIEDNAPAMKYINPTNVSDSIVPELLAKRSLSIFLDYGDVYQTAGAYRTLASCVMAVGDNAAALQYLDSALADRKIYQAPDLVASIREQLSVTFSAVNDKQASDYNRNIYIDLQEQTRQDRYLEARADMYDKAAKQLNIMIIAVIVAILVLVFMLLFFYYLNRKRRDEFSMDMLLRPLRLWQRKEEAEMNRLTDYEEEIKERHALLLSHIEAGERLALENRAKVFLVNSVMPFIDRIINEAHMLEGRDEPDDVRAGRYTYISELTDRINDYNDVLTHWIRMRSGRLGLRIESFALQPLFDIVGKGVSGFRMSGIDLKVKDTSAVVKADRALTLFMVNTLSDNARKFTPAGGTVTVSAKETDDYVEISVEDTGEGLTADELKSVFERKVYNGTGFGLLNCRGIIDKYRKTSRIFDVCIISAESEKGTGSRFFFRLPVGIRRSITVLLLFFISLFSSVAEPVSNIFMAKAYADSAYFSNIDGTYELTLRYADSCRAYLNRHYLSLYPGGRHLMVREGNISVMSPEIIWYHDKVATNYSIVLDMRNESAVAALALHRWTLYDYNNKVYTQLFKEISADNTLADYCRMMQSSQTNKNIAVILLVLVLVSILPAYYFLYYRHRIYYRFCLERINTINEILLDDITPAEKLGRIDLLAKERYPDDLRKIVCDIEKSLAMAVDSRSRLSADIELADDECRRAELERNKLHVANSVTDSSLSALKHETMYYPGRIRRIVDEPEVDVHALGELASYYRELYSVMSRQAMRQTESVKPHVRPLPVSDILPGDDSGLVFLADRNLIVFLFDILRRQNGRQPLDAVVRAAGVKYIEVTLGMPGEYAVPGTALDIFTPAADNIPYLLCRQIVRDHSEATNRHGCGIKVSVKDGKAVMTITLPRYK